MAQVKMEVNGKPVTADVEPNTLLVDFLRKNLSLTGTHVGCDTSQCGACVVHIDGNSVKSCTTLALQCDGAKVTTIEGLSADGTHPLQVAWQEIDEGMTRLATRLKDDGWVRDDLTVKVVNVPSWRAKQEEEMSA